MPENVGMNVGLGFGLNVGLNKKGKAVLRLLIEGSDRIVDTIRLPETISWSYAGARQITSPGCRVN